jgi:hypothetical protein
MHADLAEITKRENDKPKNPDTTAFVPFSTSQLTAFFFRSVGSIDPGFILMS